MSGSSHACPTGATAVPVTLCPRRSCRVSLCALDLADWMDGEKAKMAPKEKRTTQFTTKSLDFQME